MTEFMDYLLVYSNAGSYSTESGAFGFLKSSLLAISNRGLQLPLVLKSLDNILIFPSDLVGNTSNGAVLATRSQADGPHGMRSNLLLHSLISGRDTFKGSKPPQSRATSE